MCLQKKSQATVQYIVNTGGAVASHGCPGIPWTPQQIGEGQTGILQSSMANAPLEELHHAPVLTCLTSVSVKGCW